MPRANSRTASERLCESPRVRSRSRFFLQRVVWPIDDPQIVAATHFNRWLGKTSRPLNDEVEWLHDHTLAAAARQLFLPGKRFRLAVRIGDVHRLKWGRHQQPVALADARQRPPMPLVILIDMDTT